MRLSSLKVIALSTFVASGTMLVPAFAKDPMVGGAPMYANKDIIQNAIHSKDHTTLVAAVKAAGLVDTLEGPGPFTVFAPTNEAFAALPKGTVPTLLKPENKGKLTKILTAHVVPGKISGAQLKAKAMSMGGKYEMKTVSGDTLTAEVKGGKLYIMDESGGVARVTIPDVNQSNGVIHVVNKVLLPK
ncbi:MAG: fasciclin domain-containing protein [Pseudomonadota bacterium]